MSLTDKLSPAPREVRAAGVLTALPGLALLAIGVVIAVEHFAGGDTGGSGARGGVYAEVGYYVVLGAGVVACAAGLLLGKTWARSPSVVVALVLVGMGWYATGPSGQPAYGIPIIVAGAAVLVLLFRRPSRAWVLGQTDEETEEQAARRGGAEGRVAERERDEPSR